MNYTNEMNCNDKKKENKAETTHLKNHKIIKLMRKCLISNSVFLENCLPPVIT